MYKLVSVLKLLFIFFLIGTALYWNALHGPFVFDDRAYVSENTWIRSLSNFTDLSDMRYLGDLSFALNYAFWGLNPFAYHFVNVIIHVLNALLVFVLVRTLCEALRLKEGFEGGPLTVDLAALASSVIFLAHPLNTQAVSYISQRYTSLAAFFYIGALVLYLKARLCSCTGKKVGGLFYAGAVFFSVLAMKTKEICFTLPVMIALFEFALFYPERLSLKRALRIAPFFAAALIIPLCLLLPDLGSGGNPVENYMKARKLAEASGISRYNYLITESTAVLYYLKLLFYPANLHFIYHYPLASTILEPKMLASCAAVLLLMGFTVFSFIRSLRSMNRYLLLISLGMAWFFIALSVESSVIPIIDPFYEHRAYLPGIGIIIAFVSSTFYLKDLATRKGLAVFNAERVAAAFFSLALLLSIATYSRNAIWGDAVRLYKDEASKNKKSSGPHMYLGIVYFEKGMIKEARMEFEKARELNPESVYVRKTLSRFYFNTGLIDKALGEARKVLSLDPGNSEARYNVGVLYLKMGMYDEAEKELAEVIRKNPENKHALKAFAFIGERRKKAWH